MIDLVRYRLIAMRDDSHCVYWVGMILSARPLPLITIGFCEACFSLVGQGSEMFLA